MLTDTRNTIKQLCFNASADSCWEAPFSGQDLANRVSEAVIALGKDEGCLAGLWALLIKLCILWDSKILRGIRVLKNTENVPELFTKALPNFTSTQGAVHKDKDDGISHKERLTRKIENCPSAEIASDQLERSLDTFHPIYSALESARANGGVPYAIDKANVKITRSPLEQVENSADESFTITKFIFPLLKEGSRVGSISLSVRIDYEEFFAGEDPKCRVTSFLVMDGPEISTRTSS